MKTVKPMSAPLLAANQTADVELELPVQASNRMVQGRLPLRHLKYAMFQATLSYFAQTQVQVPIYLPVSVMLFLQPMAPFSAQDYATLWRELTAAARVQGQPRAAGEASVKQVFTLDKTKVPNMPKLVEVVTMKGQSLA